MAQFRYTRPCAKRGNNINAQRGDHLNPYGTDLIQRYHTECEMAQGPVGTPNLNHRVRNEADRIAYLNLLQTAQVRHRNCGDLRTKYRDECLGGVGDAGHEHAIAVARGREAELGRKIHQVERLNLGQNPEQQRAVQFERNAAEVREAGEIDIRNLYEIVNNKVELNSDLTNYTSKAKLIAYIQKIIREAAVQGLPPILLPNEEHYGIRGAVEMKTLIKKLLIRKIILEKVDTFTMARWHLENAAVSGGGGGGIEELGGLSAQVIRSAMPPPVTATAFHSGYGADARTRRRHRRIRNRKRAERRTRGRSDVSADERGRGSSKSTSTGKSTSRGRSGTRRGTSRGRSGGVRTRRTRRMRNGGR